MVESIDWGDDPEPTEHPCPGCGQPAPGHLFACRACTPLLPLKLRRRANRAWRQDVTDAATQAATQHLARHTPPTAESDAVTAHLDRITR
ncbi:MAG TPA: hypothetical protein VGD91_19445 [Trebonia sp.]